MVSRRQAQLLLTSLLAAAVGSVSGCSAAQQPAPVQPPPETVAAARDEAAPTHGLPCSLQRGEVRLCGAATDNYKASFNSEPAEPELRTWLALHELEVDGKRYTPHPSQQLFAPDARLVAQDGDAQLYLAVSVVSGPGASVQFRTGPQRGMWGVLLQLSDRDQLASEPVIIEIRAAPRPAASPQRTVRVEYRHAPELADAPAASLEHNGPGGRWAVDGHVTLTNLELGWE